VSGRGGVGGAWGGGDVGVSVVWGGGGGTGISVEV